MGTEQNTYKVKDNLLNQWWARYYPYWPVFLIVSIIGIGGAWLYLHYKLPLYEANATLLIKDEKKGTEDPKMLESLNPLSTKKVSENEIEILKSRAHIGQVVNQLKLYAPVFQKGSWKYVSAYSYSPVYIEVQDPGSLIEIKNVPFTFDKTRNTVSFNGNTYILGNWIASPWGNLRFMPSRKPGHPGTDLSFALVHPKRLIEDLSKRIQVTNVGRQSSLISLKLVDEVPLRSEDVLNTLIDVYNKGILFDKNTLAKNMLSFLNERLDQVTGDLSGIEKQMQQYKARKGAIDISSQGKIYLDNLSTNDQKISDANMKLGILNQVEQYVTSNHNGGSLVPSTFGIDDPLLTNLLNKLYDTELQYEKLKRSTGANNIEISSLVDQIEKIRPNVLDNIQSQQHALEMTKKTLSATNNSYTSLLQGLPQQERDLVQISRELTIKTSIYGFLLQKKEETALSYYSTISDAVTIDKAEYSLEPVGLKSKMVYILAIVSGIGLCILVISAREIFSRTILNRQEIEALSSFPVIGDIRSEKAGKQKTFDQADTSYISEDFRLLRTALTYLGIGDQRKKLLVTSAIPGEGKSFIAANLAKSLAVNGKRVILLEADMRNPTLIKKINAERGNGLAEYLEGKATIDEIIRNTGDNSDLFVITAGHLPTNPSELILHHRVKDLLQHLEEKFDYVLIDSTPIGIFSDGYVLSGLCDATLYIVRHKHTPKKMLERIEQKDKVNKLKNPGIVYNGVAERGFIGNGYEHGYSYYNTSYSKSTKP